MSLQTVGNPGFFWQWDQGQILLVNDPACKEVHFSNIYADHAFVVLVKELADGARTVEVPNILLQEATPICAYIYHRTANGGRTRMEYKYTVAARPRPDDYVYTETEVLSYYSLSKRLDYLEGEGLEKAVEDYMKENPVVGVEPLVVTIADGVDGEWTSTHTSAQIAQAVAAGREIQCSLIIGARLQLLGASEEIAAFTTVFADVSVTVVIQGSQVTVETYELSTDVTINGVGPDENGNFVINTMDDVEIARLNAALS